jgi:hypothetical protein
MTSGCAIARLFESLTAVARFDDDRTEGFEELPEGVPAIAVILDDQHRDPAERRSGAHI